MIFFVFFRNGHFHNFVSTLTNVVKLDVEKDNVISTFSNVVHINVEIHSVDQTLFDVVNSNVEIHRSCLNVDLRLYHVTTPYQPKHNVETTLKCLLGCKALATSISVMCVTKSFKSNLSNTNQKNTSRWLLLRSVISFQFVQVFSFFIFN